MRLFSLVQKSCTPVCYGVKFCPIFAMRDEIIRYFIIAHTLKSYIEYQINFILDVKFAVVVNLTFQTLNLLL